MPEFNVDAARKAGYNDDEILAHLTQTRKFDVDGAVKAGYSKPDIISHLATAPANSKDSIWRGVKQGAANVVNGLRDMGQSIAASADSPAAQIAGPGGAAGDF